MRTAAPGLKDIPIAREIPSVSPLEPMFMLPDREIEIAVAIVVVLGTAPTSIVPHWISSVELREFMARSQDLRHRGSVRRHVRMFFRTF